MAKAVWIYVLCVVVVKTIPISTAPKFPVTPWPSMINTIPKLPTVPSLNELNKAIKGLSSKASSPVDLEILETKINENINDCFDCDVEIIELEAEEFDAEDERIEDHNGNEIMLENEFDKNTQETTGVERTEDIIENIDNQHIISSEVKDNGNDNNTETTTVDAKIQTLEMNGEDTDKKIYETITTTTKPIKTAFETTTNKPLPKFVPIFRPKKQSRLSKINILTRKTPTSSPTDEKFTALRNAIENNDLIVQYVKNPESKPRLNIFGPQSVLENSNIRVIPLNSMNSDGVTVNSFSSNPINSNSVTLNEHNNVPLNVVPYKTESLNVGLANNAPSNLVPNNVVTLNTVPESIIPLKPALSSSANSVPASVAIIPPNTISKNPASMNIPTNLPFPVNTVPQHAAVITTNPTASFPANTLPANSPFPANPIPQHAAVITTNPRPLPVNTVPFNIALNKCDCPVNSNSALFNAPRTCPAKPVHECPIPTNINVPSYPIQPTTCTTTTFPANTVQQNAFPSGPPSNVFPTGFVPTNIAAPTIDPRYTVPSNVLPASGASLCSTTNIFPTGSALNRAPPSNLPRRVEPSCTCPSNVAPLNNISPNTNPPRGHSGSNECQKCSECPKKADLVLFRPENVTVTTVCGEFLKETTMTVLRPIHVTKLDV